MSILHPKNEDYELRGILLQAAFTLIAILILGPALGWLIRGITDNRDVWALALLVLGFVIYYVSRLLRQEYVYWGEDELYKKKQGLK